MGMWPTVHGSNRYKRTPKFSPDGRYIYYYGTLTAEEGAPNERHRHYDVFRVNIETGEEDRISFTNGLVPSVLSVSQSGVYFYVWISKRGIERISSDSYETYAFAPFPETKTSGGGAFVYDVKNDPFLNKHKSLFQSNGDRPHIYMRGSAKDGSLFIITPAAGEGYEKNCEEDGNYGYNMFVTHPERETERLTNFACASFGSGGGVSPNGSRILIHTVPRYAGSRALRNIDLLTTDRAEIKRRAVDDVALLIADRSGDILQSIMPPLDFHAYEPVHFCKGAM